MNYIFLSLQQITDDAISFHKVNQWLNWLEQADEDDSEEEEDEED